MHQPTLTESFANFIRRHRVASGKTMGQMARELGITVVYYSEVEAGRKPAFPDKKVDYGNLAKILNTTETIVRKAAEMDREKKQMLKVFDCDLNNAELAVAFGRRLTKNNLSPKQIDKIRKILNEVE